VIRKIALGSVEIFARVGCYDDGTPGELFVTEAGHSGDHVACLWDALGIVTSLALQHGVPSKTIMDHFRGMRAGDVCGTPSEDPIKSALSAPDALARWWAERFPGEMARPSLTPPAETNKEKTT
jgi:ribonucleoside-diphosphate reductase alpha chain